jgi:hypothetical protein
MTKSHRLKVSFLVRPVTSLAVAAGLAVSLASVAGADASSAPAAVSRPAAAGVLAGTWKLLPKAPVGVLPPSWSVSTVWTGRQMIVHGIKISRRQHFSGITFSYRPATNRWAKLPSGPKPLAANGDDAAVWTGSQMLVFGLTAGVYRPSTNTWRPIAHPNMPPAQQITGWTGRQVIAWDGPCCGSLVRTAETFNPATGTWTSHKSPLDGRTGAMGAWTGKELVIAGGSQGFLGRVFRNGAAYNPAVGTWRRLPPMPEPRSGGTAVWDGKEVLFLGGAQTAGGQPVLRGMAFNPVTNRWRMLPPMAFRRVGFAAVWTGRQVLVWGGLSGHAGAWVIPAHGEAFNPAAGRWAALPAAPLHGRMVAVAVWTGRRMIVWGGEIPGTATFTDGAAFTPSAPARRRQLAVTTMSRFKVVLTASRVSRLDATVTAAGYRQTSHGWQLIATRQIGKRGSWSWFATDVCNLKVTQFKPEPSSATPSDSITVSLLWGPAIGCLGPYTKHWEP